MSEHIPHHSPEHLSQPHKSAERSEEVKNSPESPHHNQEAKSPDVAELRREITTEAISSKELKPTQSTQPESSSHSDSPKRLKKLAFQKTMSNVRAQLKLPSRIGSKIIHQPTVDKISSLTGQTVARPVSLLTGGFTALVGSGLLLYMARNNGFSYNYLMIFGLFVVGWLVGLALEGLAKLLFRPSK